MRRWLPRWCEIRFRVRYGWWCAHFVMSDWEPIEDSFCSMRQCVACGVTELR